jgi:hypothetical protein
MGAPRKDIKVYVDAHIHAALLAIAGRRGMTLGEYVEALVVPKVEEVIHDVTVLAAEFRRAGISRDDQDGSGRHRDA